MFDVDFIAFLIETEEMLSYFLCEVINFTHTDDADILDILIASDYDITCWQAIANLNWPIKLPHSLR